MTTLILANGTLHLSQDLLKIAQKATYVIAADGGAKHCASLNRLPDCIIGDLDSIPEDLLQNLRDKEVEVLQFPVRKDATDLELAIDHAIKKGVTTIYFAGMLGGRWDMSLANILLLAHEKYRKVRLVILGDDCSMHILHPGKHSFTTKIKQRVSLLPLKGDAVNISLKGFEYSLNQYTIPFGSSLGMSNIASATTVYVEHTTGTLLMIIDTPGQ